MIITCPVEWPMPPAFMPTFEQAWQDRQVEFLPNYALERIETNDNDHDDSMTTLHYKNRKTIQATVAWTTWPLRAPDLVRNALPETCLHNGFVKVDKAVHTVQGATENLENVHVVGDCCHVPVEGDLNIPKAGEFAWKMGRSVGEAIWRKYQTGASSHSETTMGKEESPMVIDRRAACIAEIGHGKGLALVSDLSAFCQGTGDPHFEIQPSDTGEKEKVDWVNSYYQTIFGEEVAPLLAPKTGEVSGDAEAEQTTSRKRTREEGDDNLPGNKS